MTLWNELGFSDNPYSPKPIEGNDQGVALLVGRKAELKKLKRYISSSDTHPTLEGLNGVGKTSLVAVAGYLLQKEFVDGASQQALIPISQPFQLTPEDSPVSFKRKVLLRVAQGFIENHALLKQRGYDVPDIDDVSRWLNAPILKNHSIGGSLPTIGGLTASAGNAANTSVGFSEDGFVAAILSWLRHCFPSNSAGGFICIIDNLELLETSKTARALLEAMRDEVLGVKGLRWVLCGARGITRSVASSPRLQGVLAEPIPIGPVSDNFLHEIIAARISAFRVDEQAVAPVDEVGFSHLYVIGNRNLRNAMKYAEDFSFWAVEEEIVNAGREQLSAAIEPWMKDLAERYEQDTSGVGPRAWQVFDRLAAEGGNTSPSQYEDYGFESNQAMRPRLRELEEANLIESSIDETDNRRKTISITSRGWIVIYHRSLAFPKM